MTIGEKKVVGDVTYEVVAKFFGEHKYEQFVATATNHLGVVHFTCGEQWWNKQTKESFNGQS